MSMLIASRTDPTLTEYMAASSRCPGSWEPGSSSPERI